MDKHIHYFPLLLFTAARLVAQGGHDTFEQRADVHPSNVAKLKDPVTELARRMAAGKEKLTFDEQRGYLPAILKALHLPLSSQVLVFSKTSLQHKYINPQTPRAIFFNDNVYAGFVPDGSLMELSSIDPEHGAVFYTLDQLRGSIPHLVRGEDCLQCHATPATMGVPGHVIRSVFTRPDGTAVLRAGSFLSDHRSPIEERWGGWYVTGKTENGTHMGNAFLRESEENSGFNRNPGSNVTSLKGRFHADRYLSEHSDLVALMVLEHQARLQNWIALLRREALAEPVQVSLLNTSRFRSPLMERCEELLRYLLFADEAALKGPVSGTSTFTKDFQRLGPRDGKGRSLRDFDLKTRMFRYPCSYLIYSPAFEALPSEVKTYLYRRMNEVFSDGDTSKGFAKLTKADRTALSEILRETKPGFRLK